MTCATCKNSKTGPLIEQGFTACERKEPWRFWPLQHVCGMYETLTGDRLAQRLVWLKRRGYE
jgi:hypothetical protein